MDQNIWGLIKFSRYLCEEHTQMTDPVIQRNDYFSNPENMLLSMLCDKRKHIRELGSTATFEGKINFFIFFLKFFFLFSGFIQANIKADPSTLPTFLTSSQVFKVTDKDTVVLPCEVSNAGPYVLVWKKGIAVLSAGNVKVSPDPRINLVHGYSLEIKDVGPQDAGDYVCQIGTLEPREITHTVEILVPPRIHYVTSNGRVEVKKGSSVKLECKASGNPPPKVTWSRKNNLLPDGVQTAVTPVLSLDRVDRHQAGVYQCTANNGVGEDVSEQIVLHVLLQAVSSPS
uniref:Lachesin-like n=1 Tax=Diabrotica virgifera virgifera TaxID=50390 RepID=A0A6P7GFQ2_DIAVI